jgi:hemoglobin
LPMSELPQVPPRGFPHPAYEPEAIEQLVHRFYGRVRDDPYIGPVFAKRIDDWAPHLARMVLFWRSVLRGEALFGPGPRGGPPVLHWQIEELERGHFTRWLELFAETAREVFPVDAAENVIRRAGQIGETLALHLPT